MIINFVFDNFNNQGEPTHNIVPFKINHYAGWLNYRPIIHTLTCNNSDITEDKINFIPTNKYLKTNDKNEINIYPIFMHIEEFDMPWPILYLSFDLVDLINQNKLYIGLISLYSHLYIDYEKYKVQLDYFLKIIKIKRASNIFVMASDYKFGEIMNKPITKVHGGLMFRDEEIIGQPKFINANIWEKIIIEPLKYFNKDNINFYDLYVSKLEKPYNFLFLNNMPRQMRYFLYKFLEYQDSLKFSLYSYRNNDHADNHQPCYGFSKNLDELNTINQFIHENPSIESKILEYDELFLDGGDGYIDLPKNGTYINPYYIENTYFSVFCETGCRESGSQITEKTFKLFYYCHPFIAHASPGFLKELHNLGYETFPELFDESYDDIPDFNERLFFISKEVSKYSSEEGRKILSEKIKLILPKLKKNRETFLSKDHNKIWHNLLD